MRIHLLPDTQVGLSNLLSLAALSLYLSAPNGNAISAVRVPILDALDCVFIEEEKKKCIYLLAGTEACVTRYEAQ